MNTNPLFLLALFAVVAVTVILATGIGGFARGGEWNRKNGNRMMRWRLIGQAIAVAIMMFYLWTRGA